MQYQLFKYKEENHFNDFHTTEINGEPWFVAADVCKALHLTNPTESLKALDDDEKLTSEILRAGQIRKVSLVNESGLYSLIFRSNKPSAKLFRKWITTEVLPSIRKTGQYSNGINRIETPNFILRYFENFKNVDKGYFSVITELFPRLYALLEHEGYQIPNMAIDGTEMRPDISVGRCFATFINENCPEMKDDYKKYNHVFKNGNVFPARQYPMKYVHIFIRFVEEVWIPKYANNYFKTRDLKALEYLPKLLKAS